MFRTSAHQKIILIDNFSNQVKKIRVKFARKSVRNPREIQAKSARNPGEFTKITLGICVSFWNLFPSGIQTDFAWISHRFKADFRVKIRLIL